MTRTISDLAKAAHWLSGFVEQYPDLPAADVSFQSHYDGVQVAWHESIEAEEGEQARLASRVIDVLGGSWEVTTSGDTCYCTSTQALNGFEAEFVIYLRSNSVPFKAAA